MKQLAHLLECNFQQKTTCFKQSGPGGGAFVVAVLFFK